MKWVRNWGDFVGVSKSYGRERDMGVDLERWDVKGIDRRLEFGLLGTWDGIHVGGSYCAYFWFSDFDGVWLVFFISIVLVSWASPFGSLGTCFIFTWNSACMGGTGSLVFLLALVYNPGLY